MHSCNYTHACKLNIPRSQRETYITDGKHASLVIYVRGNTHPWETHITVTPGSIPGDGTDFSAFFKLKTKSSQILSLNNPVFYLDTMSV